jgi:hypothetical protein
LADSLFKPKQVKLLFATMTEFERDEIQAMIDSSIAEAMRKHNRNATLISACLGLTVLAFYSHGLITIVEHLTK